TSGVSCEKAGATPASVANASTIGARHRFTALISRVMSFLHEWSQRQCCGFTVAESRRIARRIDVQVAQHLLQGPGGVGCPRDRSPHDEVTAPHGQGLPRCCDAYLV